MSEEKVIPYKIYLEENEMPRQWYNVRAHMKNKPAPLLNKDTLKPITFEELQPVFCDELIRQELDDTTPFFETLKELLNDYDIKITRIAHGLPVGGEMSYADDMTLLKAMEGRREY
mgnify:CR=1 FL=1